MRSSITLAALFLAGFLTLPAAQAQPAAITDDPGYVNPGLVEGWFAERPKVEINLQGTLMKMVSAAARAKQDDEDAARVAALMDRISAIYVRIYEPENLSRSSLEARSSDLAERLSREGWETVVRVREDDEHVNIQVRSRDEDTVAGLVVLVNNTDGESVFVNIVGDISPEDLGQITGSIDGLGRLGDFSSRNDGR